MAYCLPQEVTYCIFRYLKHNNLFTCQRVCSSWYRIASEFLYNTVQLTSDSQTERFLNCLDVNDHGCRVYRLDLAWIGEQVRYMGRIAKNCPKIKEFFGQDPFVWQALTKGDWGQLRRVPEPKEIQSFASYLECALFFQSTLVELWLPSSDAHVRTVQLFNNLTSLTLSVHQRPTPLCEFDAVIQAILQLHTLKVQTRLSMPLSARLPDFVQPHGLREFHGSIDPALLYYIKLKFPNLSTLYIKQSDTRGLQGSLSKDAQEWADYLQDKAYCMSVPYNPALFISLARHIRQLVVSKNQVGMVLFPGRAVIGKTDKTWDSLWGVQRQDPMDLIHLCTSLVSVEHNDFRWP